MAQMVLFGQLEFFELYKTILVSSCGLEKVTTVVAFLFMKRRLIMVPIWKQQKKALLRQKSIIGISAFESLLANKICFAWSKSHTCRYPIARTLLVQLFPHHRIVVLIFGANVWVLCPKRSEKAK